MENVISREGIAEELVRMRLSQILVNEACKAGAFKVPVHLAMGHEAVAFALNKVIQKEDKLLLSHRNIAYHLARLGSVKPLLDEYLLGSTGLAKGKLGSMNLINPDKNIIYTSSILGNNFPVAAGIAMEQKFGGKGGAVFVLGGDGSLEEGSFYESLEIMKVHDLPVIVVIENNEWSLATKISERRKPINLEKLSAALDIPYHYISGNDAFLYWKEFISIRKESGSGPQCVEVKVATLGDWKGAKSEEFPEGKYINYHAGATPGVDVALHGGRCILREDSDDPLYIVENEIGKAELLQLSTRILENLKKELS